MAYSGNLVRSNQPNYDDNTRNWGEGVDPRHATSLTPDVGTPPPNPHVKQQVPYFIQDMVDVTGEPPYWPDDDTETAQYDNVLQHDIPTLPYGVPDNDRLRQQSGILHSEKKRKSPSRTATMVARDFTTENESRREQSLPGSRQDGALTGFALRALRGYNSLPVNNPGDPDVSYSGNYVRQGWDLSRLTTRRMPRRGLTHAKRQLHVNVAQTAIDTPGHPGPYSSPFRNFGNFSMGAQRPGVRREPQPWDQDVADDFTTDESAHFNSWGL